MSSKKDEPQALTASWLRAFTDWVEIYKLVHDLAASGQIPEDTAKKPEPEHVLTQQWFDALLKKRSEIEQTFFEAKGQSETILLQLWYEYSKNLPLALKDLAKAIQTAADSSDLSNQQLLVIERYLEAIKNQQLLFLEIARDSLELLLKKHGNKIFENQFEHWFEQWSEQFDKRFSVVALTDDYAAQFAELVHSGLDTRVALQVD